MNKVSDSDINIFLSKVISNEFKAQDLKINVNRKMTTKNFNELKEMIKQYSEFYRVNSRKYQDNKSVYIIYKFYIKTNQVITLTTIHEWETPFMFLKTIKVKSYNKSE